MILQLPAFFWVMIVNIIRKLSKPGRVSMIKFITNTEKTKQAPGKEKKRRRAKTRQSLPTKNQKKKKGQSP